MTKQRNVLIVEARFYEDIADELVAGAIAVIESHGATYDRVWVPGALEIPSVISIAVSATGSSDSKQKFDGFIALGCVIRGETSHYDFVCQECMHGISQLSLLHNVAIGNGLLTCDNRDQASVRAASDKGDKGGLAARAVLRMIDIKQDLLQD